MREDPRGAGGQAVNWAEMYYRHPELLPLGERMRDALGALGDAAIGWAAKPTDARARARVLALGGELRAARDALHRRARELREAP